MVAPEEKWLQDTGKPCGFPPAAWGQEFKWDTPHPTRGVQSAFVSWLLTLLRVCQPYPCSFSFSLCFPLRTDWSGAWHTRERSGFHCPDSGRRHPCEQ